jgi:hypothetical protein
MSDATSRVHYYEDQFLRTQDFTDEQAYHVAARRRHNIAHHIWGILVGLELVVDEGAAFLEPGVGVDGLGRELVVADRRRLPDGAFDDKGSDTLEVWLEYNRQSGDVAPEGYAACNGAESDEFYRWREEPQLRLRVPDPAFTDRRSPEGVSPGDLDFPAHLDPPDDPARFFPLFLGTVTRGAEEGDPPSVDLRGRPYAGLVGEVVAAPSGRAVLQVGAQDENDPNRVAVYLPLPDPAEAQRARVAFRADGTVELRGDTTIAGNLALRGGGAEFQPGSERDDNAPPWRVYHLEDAANDTHELRIEMARPAPGGAPGLNQVVIGSWRQAPDETGTDVERFHPCLTVADDGTVTVHGNLVVTGTLTTQAGEAAASLSREAEAFVSGGFLTGVGGASGLIDELFKSPLGPRNGS